MTLLFSQPEKPWGYIYGNYGIVPQGLVAPYLSNYPLYLIIGENTLNFRRMQFFALPRQGEHVCSLSFFVTTKLPLVVAHSTLLNVQKNP